MKTHLSAYIDISHKTNDFIELLTPRRYDFMGSYSGKQINIGDILTVDGREFIVVDVLACDIEAGEAHIVCELYKGSK